MSSSSPQPRRVQPPRWLDLRLVLGVLLVLASVLIGARVVASADSTTRMWAASRQLGPGVVLAASDLKPVRVRLPDGEGSYVHAVESVVGKTINAQVDAGALLPRAVLGATEPATTVTIPLTSSAAPRLSRGDHIAVWLSTKSCRGVTLLSEVAVQDVRSGGGGSFSSDAGENVVVRLAPELAARVVGALDIDGAVIRAGIVTGTQSFSAPLPDLGRCAAERS